MNSMSDNIAVFIIIRISLPLSILTTYLYIKVALKLLEWAFKLPLWVKDGVIGAFNWLRDGWNWLTDWFTRIWASLRIMIANIWDALEYGNTEGANKLRDKALEDLRAINLKQSQQKESKIQITLEQQIKDDMGGNLSTTQEKFNINDRTWDTKLALNEVKLSQETKADPMGGYGSEND